MKSTLVIPESLATDLSAVTSLDVESGGVLLARPVTTPHDGIRLLGTDVLWVPEEAYEQRDRHSLKITSAGYVPALQRAEETTTVPIWLHTHPGDGSSPRPSRHDHVVDEQLADLFRLRSGSDFYGALILAPADGELTFTGHLDSAASSMPIDRLLTAGPRVKLAWNTDEKLSPLPSLFDRNIRALGGPVQQVLASLRVAVVGCGGTGSAVAEQLVRLGVRELTLIDPDKLSDSNVTRVYGSTPADVGRPKVDVLADYLQRIAPDAELDRVQEMITVQHAARQLTSADVIFGCTDDNAGRLVLSRLATYMLTLVIDCGVLVTSDENGHIAGINGRVTALYPGAACLVCRDRIDVARAASEMLTPAERARRVDEGYAPDLAGIEPAVVTFTTAVAAAAVTELLERLTGFGPEPVPSEILLRLHDREISTNQQRPRDGHYCHAYSGKLGRGLTEPFLDQTWQA